ncbi:MAG: N-acyl-D-amino-acid deacylase family protein [Actinomycetota bacterium]
MTSGYALRNGRIFDGLGGPPRDGDLVIAADRISSRESENLTEVDVSELTVMPGFVDMHSHSDLELIRDPSAAPKVMQGITTEVLGQDGLSYAPSTPAMRRRLGKQLQGWNGDVSSLEWDFETVNGYLEGFRGSTAVNVAYLAPHGALRMAALDDPSQRASSSEIGRMQDAVAAALKQGAAGMSAGLMYFPGQFAAGEELEALCSVLAEHRSFFSPHHRNYGTRALESYEEMLDLGARTNCSVHLTHANMSFPINKGRASELIDLIDQYESTGLDVTLDTYPYDAGSTSLHELFPSWVKAGGPVQLLEHLADPELRDRLRNDMEIEGSDSFHKIPMDWTRLVISSIGKDNLTNWVGQTIAEAASNDDTTPLDFAADLLVAANLDVGIVARIGNEENVRRIMQDPRHCVGTDGILRGQRPHPRSYGTFPRLLGRYVRELGILSLEAVSKKSAIAYRRLGIPDRGLLVDGAKADVVVFDSDRIHDTATFENPRQHPEGVKYVFVNGSPVVWKGQLTGQLPGEPLTPDRTNTTE